MKLKSAREIVLSRGHLQTRLQTLFSSAQNFSTKPFKFTYDNGIDPDPKFCGQLTATLTLENDELLLTTTPDSKVFRKEILYKNAPGFTCSFDKSAVYLTLSPDLEFAFLLPTPHPFITYTERA